MFSKYFSLFIRTPFSVSGSPLPLCMKNVASHISKLRMLWPSSHQPLQPEGSQDGKEENTFLAIEVHIKGMISMSPDSCIFTEKMLNSSTWDVWFSLTVIFWSSRLPGLWCKISIYPDSSPTSWEQCLWAERFSLGLDVFRKSAE